MGIPTLNFSIPDDFPYPHGIYAGYVYEKAERHQAAFHYGAIPTFDSPALALEAFVIKGQIAVTDTMSFELIRYLRAIEKFSDVKELKEQIDRDIKETEATFEQKNTDQ